MKKGKNFFYRVNPESVLSELTSINHDEWLQFFLNFFHDLRNDDPCDTKTDIAAIIIKESHNFRELRSKAGKASVKQKATYVEHMLKDVQPIAVAVAVAETILKEKVKRFVPPSLQEVETYISINGYLVDAQKWMDYYSSNGWRVGKNKMVSWEAAVRTWNNSNKTMTKSNEQKTFADMKEERGLDQMRQFVEGI